MFTSIAVLLKFEAVGDNLRGGANVALPLDRRRSLLWRFDSLGLLRRLRWLDDSASSGTCNRSRRFLATDLASGRRSLPGRRDWFGLIENNGIATRTSSAC
jgi:hypothetical protein